MAVEAKVDYVEIPIAYDGLSIVVNKGNTWTDRLSIDELKAIFLEDSAAKTWADVRPEWPAIPIKVYSPGTDSGTFDYFKEVVAGKTGSIRSDMSVSEDDNVLVRGVSGDKGGIGFFGCAYYFENADKLKVVPIVNPSTKQAVSPNPESIENGSYAPFSRPLFIYVATASCARPEVDAFVRYYFEQGPELAAEVGYVRLPKNVYAIAQNNYEKRRTGTQYLDEKGEKVHGALTAVDK